MTQLRAASREALEAASRGLDDVLAASSDKEAAGLRLGSELFELAEFLDGHRSLRVAVADSDRGVEERFELVRSLIGGQLSEETLKVVRSALERAWSTPRELREGIVALGRRALFTGAKEQGVLKTVEDQLVDFGEILGREPELQMALSDRAQPAAKRRELVANLLYGKATAVAEALILQVVGRPERGTIDDVDALAGAAAEFSGRRVAKVASAAKLSDEQRERLAQSLKRLYGQEVSLHERVDESLLGGATVRVGDEVIDGSLRGRIERLKRRVA